MQAVPGGVGPVPADGGEPAKEERPARGGPGHPGDRLVPLGRPVRCRQQPVFVGGAEVGAAEWPMA